MKFKHISAAITLVVIAFLANACRPRQSSLVSSDAVLVQDTPAIVASVSIDALRSQAPLPIRQFSEIARSRNGIYQQGKAVTDGVPEIALFPFKGYAVIDLITKVQSWNKVASSASRTTVYTDGYVTGRAIKRVFLSSKGFGTYPAAFGDAKGSINLRGISASGILGGRVRRRVANSRYQQSYNESLSRMLSEVSQKVRGNLDSRVDPMVKNWNKAYNENINDGFLKAPGMVPAKIEYNTTVRHIESTLYTNSSVFKHTPSRVIIDDKSDLSLLVHQDFINALFDKHLSGQKFNSKQMSSFIASIPLGDLKFNSIRPLEEEQDIEVEFAPTEPFSVQFEEDKVVFVTQFRTSTSSSFMRARMVYDIQEDINKVIRAVRQEDSVEFIDPTSGETIKASLLGSLQLSTLRNFLLMSFSSVVDFPHIPLDPVLTVDGAVEKPSRSEVLKLTTFTARQGWMNLNWYKAQSQIN